MHSAKAFGEADVVADAVVAGVVAGAAASLPQAVSTARPAAASGTGSHRRPVRGSNISCLLIRPRSLAAAGADLGGRTWERAVGALCGSWASRKSMIRRRSSGAV
jgi:hypothetical protein